MSFNINTNLGALDAYNALAKINSQTTKAQLRLATQKKINSVSDDTSGYRKGKQIEGSIALTQASLGNISSAKNMLSTNESALSNINDLLNQIKGKVVDANDPNKDSSSISKDVLALGDEISSILGGVGKTSQAFQTNGTFTVDLSNLASTGVTGDIAKITTAGTAAVTASTIKALDVSAISTAVADALGSIGNYTQRLNVQQDYLTTSLTNSQATLSQLFDADMAMEQLNATKGSIGGQIATSMLSQLNSAPQNILSLFR